METSSDLGSSGIAIGYPTVGIVFVNWNSTRDLIVSAASLQLDSNPHLALIIVDNASAPDSLADLKRAVPDAHYVESAIKTGFAGGCNLGVARARAIGCRYVFFLNVDTEVTDRTLPELIAASAALDDRAALGSLLYYSGTGLFQFLGSATGPERGLPIWYDERSPAYRDSGPLIPTDFIIGAALFVPMAVLDRVGAFDERFFLNFEETDWCYRAAAQGIACYMVRDSIVRHRANGTVGAFDAPLQSYFCLRNELLFAQQHCSLPQRARIARRAVRKTMRLIRQAIREPRYRLSAYAELLGWRDYLLQRFGDCPGAVRRYAARFRTMAAHPEPVAVHGDGFA